MAELKKEIIESGKKGVKIACLSGEIDESNDFELEKLFTSFLGDSSVKNVVFSLPHLSYINSKVIGIFIIWHNKFVDAGKNFVFVDVNPYIHDVLNTIGVTAIIDIFASEGEALLFFETD